MSEDLAKAAPPSLRGRRALVTGSTSGLGFAMASALAHAGCAVMLHGLETAEAMQPLCETFSETAATQVAYQRADVSELCGVEELIEATIAQLGGIDILINNAVVRHFASIVDFAPENWNAALAVNLSAAFHAIRLALPGMRERNFGRIFNMTSVYGLRGTADRVGYVTTKSALLGLTRSVALENLDFDVTCHSICPGSVLTPGTEGRVTQMMDERRIDRTSAEREFLMGKQPSGHFVSPTSVSDLLIFLCGPIARDMTGAMLPVEAGWLAS